MIPTEPAALAHLALSATFLAWDIVLAGRIAQQRTLSPFLTGLSALGGLLVAPALLVLIASSSTLTGRSLHTIAWIWPVTATLIAAQAFYATATRRTSPAIGIPILLYDVLVAAAALGHYLVTGGEPATRLLGPLLSASAIVREGLLGADAALSPLHTLIPLLAPAHAPRWRTIAWWRGAVAAAALAWTVLLLVRLGDGARALNGFGHFATAELRPHPGEPFTIGLEILPTLGGVPQPAVIRNDLALLGDAEIGAALIAIDPATVTNLALDSLRRALEPLRRDTLILIAAIRSSRDLIRGPPGRDSAHLAVIDRVARRLRPDYILPVDPPHPAPGTRSDLAGIARIDRLVRLAGEAAKRAHPRVRIALSITPATARDSALYRWAVSPASPLDAVGFTFTVGAGGATELEARLAAADRWMRAAETPREHWVFRAGGLPTIHSEEAQEQAIAGILGWAMPRAGMRGAVVTHAGDYGTQRGMRSVSGRVRPAFNVVVRAGRETGR